MKKNKKNSIKKNQNRKVVVAMSGGVDSSVAAALLKQQGFNVVGVFMQFWFPAGEKYGENRCCSLQSWQEAQKVAEKINIPIYKVNFGKQFKKMIVDGFLSEYRLGRTPNPCVACNKFIKFDLLLKYAKTVLATDYLATGHYARLRREFSIFNFQFSKKSSLKEKDHDYDYQLLRARDLNKDQTYFLYNLTQNQLKYLLFPLGDYTKDKVRQLAKEFNLPVFDKKDSQEICFVGSSHYNFLKKYLKMKPGDIIDEKGKTLGRHDGLPLYTMGQRSGLKLSGGPWYVAGFDRKKNNLIVTNNQKKSAIFQKQLSAEKVNWLSGEPKMPLKCQAQIRYHSQPVKCQVKQKGKKYAVTFEKAPRAITKGQSVVFYQRDQLLGGGIIC